MIFQKCVIESPEGKICKNVEGMTREIPNRLSRKDVMKSFD